MIKGVIPWILRAESALNFIDTSILVFYHQGRQGRTDIRLRPRHGRFGHQPYKKNLACTPPPPPPSTITVYPIVHVPHTWIKRGN